MIASIHFIMFIVNSICITTQNQVDIGNRFTIYCNFVFSPNIPFKSIPEK